MISRGAIWLAQLNSGANFAAVRPVKLIPDVPCPLMLIRGEGEDFVTATESAALDQAMHARGQRFHDTLWIVPGTGHLGALQANPDRYAQKLENFLNDAKPMADKVGTADERG
jgi:pimeloyl-ACP methyl ester carboxylesterase